MQATLKQQKSIDAVSSAFASSDPKQQAAVKAVRLAFGGAEPKTDPLPTNTTTTPDTTRFSRLTPTETTARNIISAPMNNQQSKEEIQAEKRKAVQGEIDALNKVFQDKLSEQRIVNKGQDRQTSSVSTLTGLAGSTEANVAATKTEALGNKQLDAIRNEQAAAVQQILSDVRTSAAEEARLQTLDARQSARDTLDMRTARSEEAVNNLSILSKTGTTAEGLKTTDPETYKYLSEKVGGEQMLKAYLTLNRPTQEIEDSGIKDGVYYSAYRNPVTGELKVDTVDVGLPTGYSKTIDAGNRIIAIPDNWDGKPESLITINKGLTPKESQAISDKNKSGANGEVSDLTNGILANVASLKDLTPSGREEVIAEIYRSGRGGELSNKMDQYAVQKADSVLPAIDLALEQLDEAVVGFLSPTAAKISGTDTFKLQSTLDTIFANIAFGELTAMRAASPTGGALGQVSERELALLGSVQASLKLGIGEDLMKKNLNKVKKVFEDIKKRASKNITDQYQSERGQLQQGEILIERDGKIGAIPESEFNSSTDKKL